ncbi:MAG: hypothetical protein IH971_09790 [Candidatus Marinimicrobia bacterium]|nr:hypothetical protein [Candidatus Neomarinimicrobiota bacterium]
MLRTSLFLLVTAFSACVGFLPSVRTQPSAGDQMLAMERADSTYFYGVGRGESNSLLIARDRGALKARRDLIAVFQVQIDAVHRLFIEYGRSTSDWSTYHKFPDFPKSPPHQPLDLSGILIANINDEQINNQWQATVVVRISRETAWVAYLAWLNTVAGPDYYERFLKFITEMGLP